MYSKKAKVLSSISGQFSYLLKDVLMASGSMPGVSGVREIQGGHYIDGGWDRSHTGMKHLLDIFLVPEQDRNIILVSLGTGNRGSACKIPAISGLDKELLSGNKCADF